VFLERQLAYVLIISPKGVAFNRFSGIKTKRPAQGKSVAQLLFFRHVFTSVRVSRKKRISSRRPAIRQNGYIVETYWQPSLDETSPGGLAPP
jgi:hypothetical protein